MNENDYINKVTSILKTTIDSEEKVNQIVALELPEDCNPLLALIHGDSTKVAWQRNYAENNDEYISDAEIKEAISDTAEWVLEKIEEYTKDWSLGNQYSYNFSLVITHGHFVNNTPQVAYVKTDKILDTKLLSEALKEREKFDQELPERNDQGHKKISVYLKFVVYKKSHDIAIASGLISDTSNPIVSTWLNQG